MKMTLLEVVQSVLSSMNSDNVNNVSDTIESSQVVDVAKDVYYELISYNDFPHLWKWQQLEAVGDITRPNYLKIPEAVQRMEAFKYNVTEDGDSNETIKEVTYLDPKDFIEKVHGRHTSESNVDIVTNENSVDMFIINDKAPDYWTSFDDEYIVTDSYNASEDVTLNGSKSSAWCRVIPSWTSSNTFTPDFPADFFPVYLAEVKSACHLYIKQQLSQKDEQKARRGLSHVRRKQRFDRGRIYNTYGRFS